MRYIIYVTLFLYSCTERISFDIDPEEELLIIYGDVTNELTYHKISIWYAVDYSLESFLNRAFKNPVHDAQVVVESDEGKLFIYIESSDKNGEYISEEKYAGKIGESYRVTVTLDSEIAFQSDWEKIPVMIPIDSLTLSRETLPYLKNGIQLKKKVINVDLFSSNMTYEDELYFKYEWEGVYYLKRPRCWVFETKLDQLIIKNGADRLGKTFHQFITAVTINNERLGSSRYVLSVKQYSITKQAYQFYNGILRNRNQGTIFDETPSKLESNLKPIGNNSSLVSGYFAASSVSVRRIEANEIILVNNNSTCDIYYPPCASCGNNSTTLKPDWW